MSNLTILCRKALLIAGVSSFAFANAACASSSTTHSALVQDAAEDVKTEKKAERKVKIISNGKVLLDKDVRIDTGKEIIIKDGKVIVDGDVVAEGSEIKDGKIILGDGKIRIIDDGEEKEILLGGLNGDLGGKHVWKFKGDNFQFDFDDEEVELLEGKFKKFANRFKFSDGNDFIIGLGDNPKIFEFHNQKKATEAVEEALRDVEQQFADAESDVERKALEAARESLQKALENMREREHEVTALKKNVWTFRTEYDNSLKDALKELEGKRIELDGAKVIMLEELAGARTEIEEALSDVIVDLDLDDAEGAEKIRVRFLEKARADLDNLEERHLKSLERAEKQLERQRERLEQRQAKLKQRRAELQKRLEEKQAEREKNEQSDKDEK